MPAHRRRGRRRRPVASSAAAAVLVALVAAAGGARADTVVLKDGKKLENVVVSSDGPDVVVINRFNSRIPEMTWGVEDRDRIPKAKVAEVIIAEPPLVEYRERTSRRLSAEERTELAAFCEKHGLKEEAARERRLAKAAADDALVAENGDAAQFTVAVKGDPGHDAGLRRLEREYVKLSDPAALEAQWKLMLERGTTRPRMYLERARRSAAQPKGRRDKVPLTVRAKDAPGGTYCIYVPTTYDPLVPTPLVLALHGGGPGGSDPKMVTGSGEEAMPFYEQLAEERGFVVVCPTALMASWNSPPNEPLVDAVCEEMLMLFNVDESRIYLTGHSMGGYGTWYWGPHRPDRWAAMSPCAGGGGPGGVDGIGLPTYIYHGADDRIVGPDGDRAAANTLLNPDKKGRAKSRFDGVYTELGGVGHGFPDSVRRDIFRWFAGRVNDRMKRKGCEPVSSFLRKVEKEEVRCFGDPAAAPAAAAGGDVKLADLVAKLERGGGSAVEAAEELAKRKDAATAKAVAKTLRSKKLNTDIRVAAARALGGIGGQESVDALAAECGGDEWRIVDEVVTSLGRIGGAATAEPLVRALRRMGQFFDGALQGGAIDFTEYEIRCQSFGRVCDALAATGVSGAAAEPVVAALEKECVHRVYLPKAAYRVPIDDRFVHIPPRARLDLVVKLRACLEKLGAARGKEILGAVASAWKAEAGLVRACE